MYFEDLKEGEVINTSRRLITPADIEVFTSMSWAVNPIFLSEDAAKAAGLPRRVSPGALTVSYAIGLLYQAGLFDHIVAMTELSARFVSPVSPGDEVQVEAQVISKRELDEKKGLIVLSAVCKNLTSNKDSVRMQITLLYRRRQVVLGAA